MKPIQSTKKKSNQIGKRTYTLKKLAQRDFSAAPKSPSEGHSPIFNLVTIQEDLLKDEINQLRVTDNELPPEKEQIDTGKVSSQEKIVLAIELLNQLIRKEIGKIAKALDLEETELQAWIDLQVMAPKQTLLTLLRIAREHNLDPLKEEVALALYGDSHWQAYITVDGYSKILNRHPEFDGIVFSQSGDESNGIPDWMECSIYRKDRSQPIVIREYFEEVKGAQAIWQKMPRRMLRHRVMQQCTRLTI